MSKSSHDPISKAMKEQLEHCSKPRGEMMNLYYALSKGVLNGDYSYLKDGDYEFTPSQFLVNRCDSECNYNEWMTCKVLEEKIVVKDVYVKDQKGKQHKLQVNEHTACECFVNPPSKDRYHKM